MPETQSPFCWKLPDWHPDWGDPKPEFDHLRLLAEAVLASLTHSRVELMVPEPGLMYLRIADWDGLNAEVYSLDEANEAKNRRYGLFRSPGTAREEEFYTDSVSEALGILGVPAVPRP